MKKKGKNISLNKRRKKKDTKTKRLKGKVRINPLRREMKKTAKWLDLDHKKIKRK